MCYIIVHCCLLYVCVVVCGDHLDCICGCNGVWWVCMHVVYDCGVYGYGMCCVVCYCMLRLCIGVHVML